METILELEAARNVCIRKMGTFTFSRTTQTIEEWESSGNREKFDEQIKQEKEWQKRLQIINAKLYDLVRKSF